MQYNTERVGARVTRRALLVGSVAAAASAVLAACGGGDAATSAPATTSGIASNVTAAAGMPTRATGTTGAAAMSAPLSTAGTGAKQTITYWIEFTDKPIIDTMTKLFIEPFEAKYPQYKVEMVPTSDYVRQVQTAAAAGALPDVFNHYGPAYAPPLYDGGYLLPLDDLAAKYGWDKKIWPWMLDAVRYKGKIISLPTEYESLHLYYNADMFAKNGWKPPTSWTELTTLTKQMQDKKIIPFVFGTSGGISRHEWWLSYAMNAYAGPGALYEGLTGARPWTDDLFVGAIDHLNELWQSGAIMDKQTAAITHDDALAVWGKQEAAMIMDGTWRIRTVGNFAKDFKWEIARLPIWRDGVNNAWPLGCGEVLCINAKAKNPEGSAALASWYFQDVKELGKWIDKVPGVYAPPVNMAKEDYAPSANPLVRDLYLDFTKASDNRDFGYLLWSAWPSRTDKAMYENIDAVFLKQMTSKQYMEKINGIFQEELKAGGVPQQPKPRA